MTMGHRPPAAPSTMPKQEAPFCLQIELTLGCNLQCHFCGLNGVQEKPNANNRFMTVETAAIVAARIHESGWNPRLEFARRGEPTLNTHCVEIIDIFRRVNPTLQIQMTANGGGLLRKPGVVENVKALFDAGLNILAIDDYVNVGISMKVRERLGCIPGADHHHGNRVPMLWEEGIEWREFPRDERSHPNHRYPLKRRVVVFLEDIELESASRQKINNHAGHGAPLNFNYKRPCAKPFREIGINWDGTIDLCCIDWASEYRIGSLIDHSLEEVWQHERMNAARQHLISGDRAALRPCLGCDHPSHNSNWLPGKGGRGRAGYPAPSDETMIVINETLERGPVERPTARAMENIYPHLGWLQKVWDWRLKRP